MAVTQQGKAAAVDCHLGSLYSRPATVPSAFKQRAGDSSIWRSSESSVQHVHEVSPMNRLHCSNERKKTALHPTCAFAVRGTGPRGNRGPCACTAGFCVVMVVVQEDVGLWTPRCIYAGSHVEMGVAAAAAAAGLQPPLSGECAGAHQAAGTQPVSTEAGFSTEGWYRSSGGLVC